MSLAMIDVLFQLKTVESKRVRSKDESRASFFAGLIAIFHIDDSVSSSMGLNPIGQTFLQEFHKALFLVPYSS